MRVQLTVAYTQNLHLRGNILLEEVHIFSMSSYSPLSPPSPSYPSIFFTYLLVFFSLCFAGSACPCKLTRGVGAKKDDSKKERVSSNNFPQ
jgi:hypothetical protein